MVKILTINHKISCTYDHVTKGWTLSVPMIQKRSFYSAVGFRDNIFAVGGFNWDDRVLNSTEVFLTPIPNSLLS